MRRLTRQLAVAIVAGAALSACSTAPPEKSALMQSVEGLDVTKRELQTLMYFYANHFAGQVDLACNEIYMTSTNPDTRRAAIEWNLNATPQMMMTCFNHDPLVGMLGAWTFTIQMQEFFDKGNGRDIFGSQQDIALKTSSRLEQEMSNLVNGIWTGGDADEYEKAVKNFAAANPLKNLRFVREGFDAQTLEAMGANVSGGLGAAGSMNEQMVALTDRANIMMPYLQRQIYWQSALLMEDSKTLAADLTDSTMAAVSEEMFGNLDSFFEFADQQRALVTRDMARERAAVFSEIAAERKEILVFLAGERNEVIKAIAAERNATMQDINALTLSALERITQESQSVVMAGVDHVYARTLQLLVIPFLALVIFVVVVMLWLRSAFNRMLTRLEDRLPD
jgi:hypothetical protein